MASGGTQVYQAKVRNGRGEDRDVVFHKAVLQNLAGDVVGMVGMVLDITDREASARELARTKALLEAILEQSPTPILVVDAPDTTIRICNHAALEVLGILEEPRQLGRRLDGITRNWSYLDIEGEIIPEERLPIARALQGRATPACAIRVLRKDGSERTCLGFGVPILDQGRETDRRHGDLPRCHGTASRRGGPPAGPEAGRPGDHGGARRPRLQQPLPDDPGAARAAPVEGRS